MTRYVLRLGGLLALLIGFSGGTKAADEPKSKPPATHESTAPTYITVGDIVGEVLKVDDKSITVRVTWYATPAVKMSKSKAVSQAKQQHKDYVMDFATDAQVRVKHLQPKLDDKGKQTNYSPDELQKMRGNPLLPGYIGELSMIKVGQIVEAHLVHAPKEKDFIVRWALILNEKGKSTTTASTATSKN